MFRRPGTTRIGFDLGSSQTTGPRGPAEVGALMVSTFYSEVSGQRSRRAAPASERDQRSPRA